MTRNPATLNNPALFPCDILSVLIHSATIVIMQRVLGYSIFGIGGLTLGTMESEKFKFWFKGVKQSLSSTGSSSDKASGANALESPRAFMDKVISNTNECGEFAVLSTTVSPATSTSSSSPKKPFPRSRMIQPFQVEIDETRSGSTPSPVIYFNTNRLSRKFKELNENENVTLTYVNPKQRCYICYEGVCERVPYPQSTRHWRDWLYVFYPEGVPPLIISNK
jgi:hypothetical protein